MSRTRTDVAVDWVVWHAAELVAVGVPVLLAVWVAWWFAALSLLASGLWIGHEVRTRRTRAATTVAGPPAELTAAQERATHDDRKEATA